jgi:hypothetical protein
MKKKPKKGRLIETFMDEYTGKAEARRVREAAKSNQIVDAPGGRMPRVRALEQENAALRAQLVSRQYRPVVYVSATTGGEVGVPNAFEQEYNRPEPVEEEVPPRGRKIVLDPE